MYICTDDRSKIDSRVSYEYVESVMNMFNIKHSKSDKIRKIIIER